MKKTGRFYSLALIVLALLTAACGNTGGQDANGGGSPTEPGAEEQPILAFDAGTLLSTEGGGWLVAAYKEGSDGAYIDASFLSISDGTLFHNGNGDAIPADSFQVGALVEAWRTGPLLESYPTQSGAYKFVLLDSGVSTAGDLIGRNDAVRAALEADAEYTGVKAVKSAELDEVNGQWSIELVRFDAIDEPLVVQIDASSGELVTEPVAENDAFRVFAPEQEAVAAPGFTVEGEARVFEAAFSWTLEDGHNILAEGHEMTDAGAPEWGKFSFDIDYEYASQPHMMLILYVPSANDGSPEHQLVIPLKAPEDRIRYLADQP